MSVSYKVSINNKNDHVLYYDTCAIIRNVNTGKTFTDINDAIKDISNDVVMLLTFLDIEFEVPNKGSIYMKNMNCDRHSLDSIYLHLEYLSNIQCDIETYITLKEFANNIMYYDNVYTHTKIHAILLSLVTIYERYERRRFLAFKQKCGKITKFIDIALEKGDVEIINILLSLNNLYKSDKYTN